MNQPSVLKDGETLLPGFEARLIDIGKGRKIVAFDSHPQESSALYVPAEDSADNCSKKLLPVVFLHGFPDNVFSFRLVVPILVASGRRCILLSSPGYDQASISSSGPDGRLDVPTVAKDYSIAIESILDLISSPSRPSYHLVGHDWGALHAKFIASEIHSRRVASLSLAAVPHGILAGFKKHLKEQMIDNSWYMAFFQLPYLPEWWILGPLDGLSWLWRRWPPSYDIDLVYLNSVRKTLSQPGVMRSAINMYRDEFGKALLVQYLILRCIFIIRWLIGFGNRPFQPPSDN